MPTYVYQCFSEQCVGEFEEFHSINMKLETCPLCKEAGRGEQPIERLISGGSGRGIVELTGHELKQKVKEDGQKMKREIYSNESKIANVVGETRYHQNELSRTRR